MKRRRHRSVLPTQIQRISSWGEARTRAHWREAMFAVAYLTPAQLFWIKDEMNKAAVAVRMQHPEMGTDPRTGISERRIVLEERARGEDPASNARKTLGLPPARRRGPAGSPAMVTCSGATRPS